MRRESIVYAASTGTGLEELREKRMLWSARVAQRKAHVMERVINVVSVSMPLTPLEEAVLSAGVF